MKSSCRGAKLVAKRNGLEANRFAVTLVRKFGTAVRRNYARRILKEIYRRKKREIPNGYDVIVILFAGDYSYHDREQQFMMLIQRANFG
jgi:ribonuclease P protein component